MAGTADFMQLWREALQKWERQTNEALNAASGDEAFSRAMNQSMAAMARLQALQGEAIERALTRHNLPSRADFRELGSRLDSIEAQLSELNRLFGEIVSVARGAAPPAAPPVPRPARTRKPPQDAAS
ncbi:hypothetical protein [Phenylobacterium sp.]|jgi:hypothetical protein|uniref:hypothetical protein n=1 Tax=Phenylobacterium sp. TaxID=1871053 RepID=UPI002F95A291